MSKYDLLEQAILSGNAKEICGLVEREGLDVNSRLPSGDLPLTLAMRNQSLDVAKILFRLGASPYIDETGDGRSILQNAFEDAWMYEDLDLLEFLSKCGLQMEQLDQSTQSGRQLGRTFLMMAVRWSVKLTKFVLEHGADANVRDKEGWTALMCAMTLAASSIPVADVEQVVALLLAHGADPLMKNDQGETASDILAKERYSTPEEIERLTALLSVPRKN